ncbi:MAG: sodium-dependent transporter [Bacteroidaceae bacterium]|nr:sodium-dependent transporter [Bacteroidaceae bacterium]
MSVNNNGSSVFASKVGAILAAAGSAVGLGNIWRFPTETGANGGAAFILIYVFFMAVIGVPIMVTEFAIGRHGGKDVMHSFEKMSGGRKGWRWMGLLPVVAGFLVLSYYAVVAGWTLFYAVVAGVDGFDGMTSADFASDFELLSTDPLLPILWLATIIILTVGVVALGVQKGIERGAKIMMPLLFIFVAILVVCSLTLPGATKGLEFLFKPDFSQVTGATALSAMGQAFFSLSVGICCLCTYACYFRKDVNLIQDGVQVATIDTLVALMAGLVIFPAVYSIPGMEPDAGPSLVFVTLPNVFQRVFGDIPLLAYLFSLVFYLLLVMAALTSSISMLEMSASYFHEELRVSRPVAASLVGMVCIVLGSVCSLSFGVWSDVTVFGLGFFDLFDFLVAKLLMPLGSLAMCIFVGWVVDESKVREELTNGGTVNTRIYPVYLFLVRYVAPVGILLIFINELWG